MAKKNDDEVRKQIGEITKTVLDINALMGAMEQNKPVKQERQRADMSPMIEMFHDLVEGGYPELLAHDLVKTMVVMAMHHGKKDED